jgi:inorganic pyrophosphatase
MKNLVTAVEAFDKGKKCLNVIIETPKGSRVKYAYGEETRLFEVKKALPEGMVFPFNFGFVPSTKAADGDPLDILILNEEPLVPGCLIKARVIAVIKARQTEKGETTRNDRLIGMAIVKQSPTFMEELELSKKTCSEIEHFFISYNELSGKKFKVLGQDGPRKAIKLVKRAVKEFERE